MQAVDVPGRENLAFFPEHKVPFEMPNTCRKGGSKIPFFVQYVFTQLLDKSELMLNYILNNLPTEQLLWKECYSNGLF